VRGGWRHAGIRLAAVLSLAPTLAPTLALTLSCASTRGLRPLSEGLPASVPSASERAGWERIAGDYETPSEHVRYALFVDPARPLLFRITQYRISPRVTGSGGRVRLEDGTETLIWNETPGVRGPLRCFTRAPRDGPAAWRDVVPGTAEFVEHMRRAMEIYVRVQSEGRAGPRVE